MAAIVLNWNGFDDTCAAIESLFEQTWPGLTIHVVDNASANDEAGRLAARYGARIRLHRHAGNLGFAEGHNVVLRELLAAEPAPDYIALLNNDAVARADWVEQLVAVADRDPSIGACASLMCFADRPEVVENAGIVMLRSGEAIPRGRGRAAGAFTVEQDVLGACGGAVLYRAAALRQIGLFRGEFFLNFEDVDLSLRLIATGWRCRFAPRAIVRHGLNRSIAKVRDEAFAIRSIRNMDFAWLINMPWPVVVGALPWLFAAWVLAPIGCLCVGQWSYARLIVRGHLRTMRERADLLAARRELRPRRRASAWALFWRHGSTVAAYARFLRDVVVLRRRQALR
ncbi:MAG: glycosyltransferase family 2 protein [Planctomycetes bacterium]|nr:glycosyltransferase family 2 protein [Planctomycetota bacterium]